MGSLWGQVFPTLFFVLLLYYENKKNRKERKSIDRNKILSACAWSWKMNEFP